MYRQGNKTLSPRNNRKRIKIGIQTGLGRYLSRPCLSNGSSLTNKHNHFKRHKRLSYTIIEKIPKCQENM